MLTICSACQKQRKINSTSKEIPTLCFHGLGGSYKDELSLVKQVKEEGKSNCIVRADVDEKGHVKLKGKIKTKSKNPVVMVNYKDNVQPNFTKNGYYATKVVKSLQRKYHFKKINMVAYSLGNVSAIYYQILNGNKNNMPKLNKQVDIAGHFDGANFPELPATYRSPLNLRLDKEGKPNRMNATYHQMLRVRSIYKKENIQILNLIGDSQNQSDGVIKNNSSRSLRYLVADKNYHEKVFYGSQASHGNLIKNSKVIRTIISFLW